MRAPLSLDDIQTPYVRGLVYGGAGVGKTVFCCGSQSLRTFHFDIDDGIIAARNWKGEQTQGLLPTRKDLIKFWPIKSRADFQEGYAYYLQHQKEFDLVVIDTATELQRLFLQEIMNNAKHVVADQRDWGISLSIMEEISRQFKHVPAHTMWAAHEQFYTDELLRRNIWRPNFRGQFAVEYAKHFSFVARYTLIDQQVKVEGDRVETRTMRVLNCERDASTDAKHRGGLSKYEWPNIDQIISKLSGQ